jgi:cytoskeletal protein RodZ
MSREVTKKSPGAILKQARQALGLSLGEVAAMTRIPRTMLTHLEGDRFDEYSADVFVRGHIRSYSQELKLDPEKVIQAFERHTGKYHSPKTDELESGDGARKSISKAKKQVAGIGSQMSAITRNVRAAHVVAVVLVLVFLLFVVNLVTGGQSATAKDPAQFPTATETDWEVEQAAQETRWALDQPDEKNRSDETNEADEAAPAD